MLAAFSQKLGQASRRFLPVVTALCLVLLGIVIWPLPFIGAITPAFGLAAIYYWALYRPDLLRPLGVFLLGVLNDAVHLLPIGLSAFIFIGIYQLAVSQRRFFVRQPFTMLWAGFALVAFLSSGAEWLVLSLLRKEAANLLPAFVQLLFTIAAFPLPAWAFIRLQRAFLSQSEA